MVGGLLKQWPGSADCLVMQVGHFPAAAADSLIEGYCDDFVSLAAILAQTLEQVSIRGIECKRSRPALERIERGMRNLADAIQELLQRGTVGQGLSDKLKATEPAAADTPTGVIGAGGSPILMTPGVMPGAAPAPMPAPMPAPAPAQKGPPGRQQQQQPGERFSGMPSEPWFAVPPSNAKHPGAHAAPGAMSGGAASGPPAAPPGGPFAGSEQLRAADIGHVAPRPAGPRPGAPRTGGPRDDNANAASAGLRGTNASMPLLSVFQFLGRMRKSGTMKVRLPGETMTFEFAKGCVQACNSDGWVAGERLGELLFEIGACTRDQLAELINRFGNQEPGLIGAAAVRENMASNGQVLEALELQVRRRFKRACQTPEAAYEFLEGAASTTDGRMRIAPSELMFDRGTDGRS